jgi:hypothetical protein
MRLRGCEFSPPNLGESDPSIVMSARCPTSENVIPHLVAHSRSFPSVNVIPHLGNLTRATSEL